MKVKATPKREKKTESFDYLLNSLLVLAKLNNRPISVESLTAGLPISNQKLTGESFIKAAARAGLRANIVKAKLIDIIKKRQQAVLLLQKGEAYIFTGIDDKGNPKIIDPKKGDKEQTITLQDLAKLYINYAIMIEPGYKLGEATEAGPQELPKKKIWLWRVVKKAMPLYVEILVASLLINLFTIASPLFVMNVYDRVVPNNAIQTLWVLAIGVIIVFGFDFILRNLRAYFIEYAGKKIDTAISGDSFEQLLGLQMAARPASTGSLTNTVHSFDFFRDFMTSASVSLLVDIPFALLFIIVIALLGGTIALVPIIIIPIVLIINLLVQRSFNDLAAQTYQYAAEKHNVLIESLAGVETVKSMRAEGLMQTKWEYINQVLAKLGVRMRTLANIGINSSIYAQHMAVIAVVIVGVYKIAAGDLTIGALIACVILAGRALAPISQAAILLTKYRQSQTSLNSMDNVMQMPVERPHDKNFLHLPKVKGSIEFNNVSFSYPNQLVNALENISFKIKPGEWVGIVGRTGSGKSTLEKLILKLYQPTSGSILIDGTEMQQLDPAELRYHIGYVPQDVVLFNGTIRDNIAIGSPQADDVAIMRAAKLSGVSSFVSNHPEGLERRVAERGNNLSGGQRQAIAIARALLLNPSILVFDEPSHSLDERLVRNFIARFQELFTNKTIVMITHSSSLLSLMKRVVVMDQGKIILDGSKDEVLQKLRDITTKVKGEK